MKLATVAFMCNTVSTQVKRFDEKLSTLISRLETPWSIQPDMTFDEIFNNAKGDQNLRKRPKLEDALVYIGIPKDWFCIS